MSNPSAATIRDGFVNTYMRGFRAAVAGIEYAIVFGRVQHNRHKSLDSKERQKCALGLGYERGKRITREVAIEAGRYADGVIESPAMALPR